MDQIIHPAPEGTRTKAIPGSTEITALFFDFKTGEQINAGTDARVTVKVGDRAYAMPRRRIGHDLFERGGIDVVGFPAGPCASPREPRLDLDRLRSSSIVLSQDSSGKRPAWCVERLTLLVKLALPQEPVLEFKHWTDLGWLDAAHPSLALQEASTPKLLHA